MRELSGVSGMTSVPPRRVAVTGFGVVSALGLNWPEHAAGLRAGRCGIGPLSSIQDDTLTIRIGAEVSGFAYPAGGGSREAGRGKIRPGLLDRFSQFALAAADEAVCSSGIAIDSSLAGRAATVIGSSQGGATTLERNYRLLFGREGGRVEPLTIPRSMANAAASLVSMAMGLTGPAWCVSTACASSNHAIGQAMHLIRHGGADIALAGGAEAGLTLGSLKAWEGLRVMSPDACRPFSRNRSGMVQGEGAAVLVLEEMSRAVARDAPILCELVGFGMTADASDIVQPSEEGACRAMQLALADAGLGPESVGYVNAHGTATLANDRNECSAIRRAFGAHAETLAMSSTKSMHGHAIGASGAIEMGSLLLAIREGIVPPTIGHQELDPECDLDVTPNQAARREVEVAMSNNFAFGGMNAVLVASAWDG